MHPSLLERQEARAADTSATLLIIADNVRYMDGRATYSPAKGTEVWIKDPDVWTSLVRIRSGLIVDAANCPADIQDSSFWASGDPVVSEAPAGTTELTWASVQISSTARALLEKNAPNANPLEITPEDLLAALEGSAARAAHVRSALEELKAQRANPESTESDPPKS